MTPEPSPSHRCHSSSDDDAESSTPGIADVGERVLTALSDGVLTVELASPERLNAIDLATARARRAAARGAHDSGVRCVLLTSQDPDFCVGGDARTFAAATDPAATVRAVARAFHEAVWLLATAPAPLVTAVQGWSAGAGMALGLRADVVVGAAGARWRSAYTGIGLSPDGGLTELLPRVLGPSRAAELILTNRVIDAPQALEWGLVGRIATDSDCRAEAADVARELAHGSATAHVTVRRLLGRGRLEELRAALDAEERSIAECAGSADGLEGIRSFAARSVPAFTGAQAHRAG
ncbi:enoyl-CoA hydratase/isomerase family protein [Streptomyces fulvoviolaceus]|uniref:enoyl-CoA hydratase/isomerase family protein n=1 Tax=Streptomyces fulvoviolaceus TaxID=285535 RepID=UPI000693F379|nr:enoyl-CoA hydratase-related protein [Streptomyces fulvoviolaceus]